jgi:REP element-mobilizing transposase RayT
MAAEFQPEHIPKGYLITFRAYGTWLHGDARGSVDRHHNRYGSPRIRPNEAWRKYNEAALRNKPVNLRYRQRLIIKDAVREICKKRHWDLWTTNVRSNHVHSVVTAPVKPEKVRAALKANATRKLRETGLWKSDRSPWADRGSRKYLWTDADLNGAIAYVEYEQGDE